MSRIRTRSRHRGTNRCGREAGTIESRGCNTFHGGINARGTLWIRVDRDREAPYPPYPPPYWQSVKSTVLHTIPHPLQPLYPVLRPHHPGTIGRGQKINASLQPAFHQLRGSRFRENADGLIRQPLGNRYWGAFNAVEYSSLFSMSIESLLTLHDRYLCLSRFFFSFFFNLALFIQFVIYLKIRTIV